MLFGFSVYQRPCKHFLGNCPNSKHYWSRKYLWLLSLHDSVNVNNLYVHQPLAAVQAQCAVYRWTLFVINVFLAGEGGRGGGLIGRFRREAFSIQLLHVHRQMYSFLNVMLHLFGKNAHFSPFPLRPFIRINTVVLT